MRSFILPAAVIVGTALSGMAFAAGTTSTGMIKALDMTKHTLTLDNGTVYQLPAGYKAPGLKVGDKVSVTWDMMGTTHDASAVGMAK